MVRSIRPPQVSKTSADSYGTGRLGTRGLFRAARTSRMRRRPSHRPPVASLPRSASYVLLDPDPLLVRTDPSHIRAVRQWVEAGGRLVISPAFPDATEQAQLEQLSENLTHFGDDVLAVIGLDDVQVELILSSDVPQDRSPDDEDLVLSRVAPSSTTQRHVGIDQLFTFGEALPRIELKDDRALNWETRTLTATGEEIRLAVGMPVGAGEVVVVADSTLLCNACLNQGDNAPWAARLLAGHGANPRDTATATVIVDEFYHGHSVRGNSWWLLTQPSYAMLAVSGLLLLTMLVWRAGRLLGPPLAAESTSRRAISEYISAMGHFFLRSPRSQTFLIEQVRDGVWHRLCLEYGVPPASRDLERLIAAATRSAPARATQIQEVWRRVHALTQGDAPSTNANIQAVLGSLADLVVAPADGQPIDRVP
ncbi:MAG: DUF4350 domain-containing protein [Planctomycetaceae bacterium]